MKDSVDWYRLHECGFDIISKVMFVCPKILTPLIFANMDRSTAMFEDFFFSVVLKYTVAWARIFYQPLQNLTTSSTCAICPNVYKVIWLLKNDASSFTHLSSVAPAHNGNIGLPMEIVKSVFFFVFLQVFYKEVWKNFGIFWSVYGSLILHGITFERIIRSRRIGNVIVVTLEVLFS